MAEENHDLFTPTMELRWGNAVLTDHAIRTADDVRGNPCFLSLQQKWINPITGEEKWLYISVVD